MTKTAFIPAIGNDPLPGTNEMEDWARAHKMHAHKQRQKWKQHIMLSVLSLPKRKFKCVWITYTWIEKNRKRDPDNIAGFKKVVLDGLVDACVIKTDGWRHVAGFTDVFKVDRTLKPGVFVTLREVDKQ